MNITKNTENQAEGIIKTYAPLMRFFHSQKIKNTFWNGIELKDLEQFMEFNGLILSIVPAQAIALAGYLAPKAVSVGVSKNSMNDNAVKNLRSEKSKEYIKNIEILSLREFWEKYSKKTEKIRPVLTADLNKILGNDVQVAIFEKVIMKSPSIKYGYCYDKKAVTFFKTTKNISEALSIWIEYSETNSIDYCLGYDSKKNIIDFDLEKESDSSIAQKIKFKSDDYSFGYDKQNKTDINIEKKSISSMSKKIKFESEFSLDDIKNIKDKEKRREIFIEIKKSFNDFLENIENEIEIEIEEQEDARIAAQIEYWMQLQAERAKRKNK